MLVYFSAIVVLNLSSVAWLIRYTFLVVLTVNVHLCCDLAGLLGSALGTMYPHVYILTLRL